MCRLLLHRNLVGTPPSQVLSEHLVAKLNEESAEIFRPPKPGKEADWASYLPFPLVAVLCESDAGLANAGKMSWTAPCGGITRGAPRALHCCDVYLSVVFTPKTYLTTSVFVPSFGQLTCRRELSYGTGQ